MEFLDLAKLFFCFVFVCFTRRGFCLDKGDAFARALYVAGSFFVLGRLLLLLLLLVLVVRGKIQAGIFPFFSLSRLSIFKTTLILIV